MSNKELSSKELNKKVAVAGVFFVFMQLFVRGISFILTPVYTRLVSTAQYGEIRVYESWLLILVPIFSLSLYRSIERAKYDFRDEFNEYVSSVQTLSYISILTIFAAITLFFRKPFMSFAGVNWLMYIFMILYTFAHAGVLSYQRREKQLFRYKSSVVVTACMMISASVLSVLLLYWGNITGRQDELVNLRVIGYYAPQIVGGIIVIFLMWKQGHFCVDKKYWKYALCFSLPLIPETVSIQIMNQADKIMIKNMVGPSVTGIFALATTVSFIIWILEDAVWGAWLPWLYEKISRNESKEVARPWYFIAYIFGFISWMLVLFAPEIVYILGGDKYQEAVYLVAPMVTGTLYKFYSYIFTALENYQKKTVYCGLGTAAAMVINIGLNIIGIKYIGYQAAAYTTAISYFLLLFMQGVMEQKVCGTRCVSLGKMLLIAVGIMAINIVTMVSFTLAWYLRSLIALAVTLFFVYWNRNKIKDLLKILKVGRKGKC